MKLNKLTAVLLAFCMLLTCVPAMAATVTIPGGWSTTIIPEDGVYGGVYGDDPATEPIGDVTFIKGASVVYGGDSIRFGTDKAWYVSLTGVSDDDYANYVVNNDYIGEKNPFEGVYAKGNFSIGEQTIYYKDVPVSCVGRDSNSKMVFLALQMDHIAANQYSSDYETKLTEKDPGYVTRDYINSIKNDIESAAFTGFYGMEYAPEYIETGHFPTGTMFVATDGFKVIDGVAVYNGWGGYTMFYRGNNDDGTKAVQTLCVPSATGEYEVWALVSTHANGSNGNRKVSVIINNGGKLVHDTVPPCSSGGSGAAWVKLKNEDSTDYQIALTKDKTIDIVANCEFNWGRFGGLAFVPVGASDGKLPTDAKYFETTSGKADANSINYIKADDLKTLQSVTIPAVDLTVNTVSATVNGTNVKASKWHDYAETKDIFGDVINGPSVYDAIVAAGLDVKADGNDARSIFVNGEQIYNADKVALAKDDVVTVYSGDTLTIDNFSAVKAALVRETEGNVPDGMVGLKYCLNTEKLTNTQFSFVTKDAEGNNNLVGAHLAGYWSNISDMTISKTDLDDGATWQFGDDVESVTVLEGTCSYMMNKPFTASIADSTANRISVNVPGATFGNSNKAIFMKDAAKNIAAFKEANGFQYIKTGDVSNAFADSVFNKDNLFITNAKADGSIKVVRKDAEFAITTNGVAHLALVSVKADGTKAVEEVTATVLTPYVGTVADGETIYVWGYNQITGEGMNINETSGISMIPMCAPIK